MVGADGVSPRQCRCCECPWAVSADGVSAGQVDADGVSLGCACAAGASLDHVGATGVSLGHISAAGMSLGCASDTGVSTGHTGRVSQGCGLGHCHDNRPDHSIMEEGCMLPQQPGASWGSQAWLSAGATVWLCMLL